MNIGKALVTSSWTKLDSLIDDFTFVDETIYQLQVQGEFGVRLAELEDEPSATSEEGIIAYSNTPVVLTKQTGKDIYVKLFGCGNEVKNYVNINSLEA
jgi:hypothetical protein